MPETFILRLNFGIVSELNIENQIKLQWFAMTGRFKLFIDWMQIDVLNNENEK